MQGVKFIIPDYQRPYKWDNEKCEILWQDLTGFFADKKPNEEYYLGTIVTCKSNENPKSEIEVIDGQQRITSILLLLRAFYSKLENSKIVDENITGLKNQIAPCLWDVNPISGKVSDTSLIHIESRVATESDNDVFHSILKSGLSKPNAADFYSKNYQYFFEQCEKYAMENPMQWQAFCVAILKNCIILPIECEQIDTALTIFSTLNDRGLPLSDSDIFKAQLYRTFQTPEEKSKFTSSWKELTETVEDAGITLDDIFRAYSHVIRGRNKDRSKEIGLRKYYAGLDNKFGRLKQPGLMAELQDLAEFWYAISEGNPQVGERILISDESFRYLHCLAHYPNEYWKYVTSAFFFKNKNSGQFHSDFSPFLKFLVSFLFSEFVQKPTVNAIKDACYQFCIDILDGKELSHAAAFPQEFPSLLSQSVNYKISRAMILLHAYLNPNQITLVDKKFEIEHIFPRVWQSTNYNGWSIGDAQEYLEKYGNKVAIGKKLNIQAGNGYFGQKKRKYVSSNIQNVKDLSVYPKEDWVKSDIENRENDFREKVIAFFKTYLK